MFAFTVEIPLPIDQAMEKFTQALAAEKWASFPKSMSRAS
jgi:hypothetical protein